MTGLIMVAHPDDCIIFGLGMIHHRPTVQWNICYLTYTQDSDRGQEISAFWQRRNIPTIFLGHNDDWHDIENKTLSFDTDLAACQISKIVADYDFVITHDDKGDYGHPHHVFVNQCVRSARPDAIMFSPFGKGNLHMDLPDNLFSVSEIPLHYASVKNMLSPVGRMNEYLVPASHLEHLQ